MFELNYGYLRLYSKMNTLIRLNKYNITLLFVLWTACAHLSAQDNTFNIAAIRVEGPVTTDKAMIVALSGLSVGQTINIPGQEVTQAIKLLWKQGLFSNIDIQSERYQGKNVFLLIKLEEKPRITKYKILGVKKGDIDELRPKLELRAGSILNDQLETNIQNIVRNYYKEKSFIYPKVILSKVTDSSIPNGVAIQIKIDRGFKYVVKDIVFIDNNKASTSTLKKAMKENKTQASAQLGELFKFKKHLSNPGWDWYDYLGSLTPKNIKNYISEFVQPNIFTGAKYKPEELKQADFASIKEQYATLGYRDAKIVWDTVVEESQQKVKIFIKVDEGKKYYIRNITWVGNTKYPDSILTQILDIRKGDPFDQKKLDQRLQQNPEGGDVSGLYMDDGYLFFRIDPQEVAIVGDSVDYLMRVYEGNQSTINQISISGNVKTNEHVIRRELKLRPGDKFDRSKLIRTQRELAAMGYFNPEGTQIIPKPKEDGTVDIDLIVEEKPNDQLSLSLGYANFFYGQVGMNFTNFSLRNMFNLKTWKPLPSGDGQTLAINVQSSGVLSQIFNVSFTEPWLGGKSPTSLTVAGTHSRFNNPIGNGTNSIFIRNNLSVEVGKRLRWPDDYFVAFFGVTMENNILENNNQFGSDFSTGVVNNLFGRFTLSRNSLNGPIGPQIYPTTGSNLSFSVQATLPYSQIFKSRDLNYEDPKLTNAERWNWIEYHKWKFSTDMYMPIAGNLVARFASRFGTIGSFNSRFGISPFERFRIGGDGLVAWNQFGQETYALRGYDDREVTINKEGDFFQGATVFNKYIFELRYPIMLNPGSSIYTMLFAEAGNGWERFKDFDPFNVKKSYGMGVRFFLPMFGLLGFDYGLGVDKFVPEGLRNASIFDKYGKFRFILSFEPQ
jgi:outer membrane protein insertion porin family